VAGTVSVSLTVKDAAGLTNTVTKSVTTLSGSTSGGSNEPTGMSMIADRPFNCVSASSCGEGSWYYSGPSSSARVVSDATAPRSGSSVVHQLFTTSLSGGSGPASIGLAIPDRRVLYQAIWMKLSPNFDGHSTGVNKITHFWINGVNRVFTMARGSGSGTLLPAFGLQQLAAPYNTGSGSGTSVNLLPNVGSKSIQRGQWHKYEVVLTANTAGSANGSVEMWVDGTKVLSYSGIMFTAAGGNSKWEEVKWNPTWGGIGDSISQTFYMAVDHMYLSGK
jgi:hypothetical protein